MDKQVSLGLELVIHTDRDVRARSLFNDIKNDLKSLKTRLTQLAASSLPGSSLK